MTGATLNLSLLICTAFGVIPGSCADSRGFLVWPITVILKSERSQSVYLVLQGSMEKLPGSHVAACWKVAHPDPGHLSTQRVFGISCVFMVFNAMIEFSC